MIGFIKGKVVGRRANSAVILTASGVGYKVFLPVGLISKPEVELFTHHHIREDASDLYGFANSEELQVFELLLSVSGVGPKAALNLVSALGKTRILDAISAGDVSSFKAIPGIGNKVAAKIIVELKGKVATQGKGGNLIPDEDETVEALVSLGYKKNEINPILSKMPKEIVTVQDKVKYVLKSAGKKS